MKNNNSPKGPIFIAGPERSGTSLIYALLASHPNIAMTRRTNMWTHYYKQYGDLSQPENFEELKPDGGVLNGTAAAPRGVA